MKNNVKAFSLVELIIVIVVIAIIAALIIPKIQNIGRSAKRTSAKNFVETLNAMVAHYKSTQDPSVLDTISLGNSTQKEVKAYTIIRSSPNVKTLVGESEVTRPNWILNWDTSKRSNLRSQLRIAWDTNTSTFKLLTPNLDGTGVVYNLKSSDIDGFDK